MTFGSRRVTTRRVWALPSKPPIEVAAASSARLAVMPERRMPEVVGQARRVHDVRVGPQLLAELAAHLGNLEGVREARAHEVIEIGPSTWVFSPRRRSAEEWRMRARSRSNSVRSGRLVFLGHPTLGIGGRVRATRVATINTGDCQGKLIHGAILLRETPAQNRPRPRDRQSGTNYPQNTVR